MTEHQTSPEPPPTPPPTPPTPPPVPFPAQRIIRTVIQTTAAVILSSVACITTASIIAPQLLEAIRELLPDDVYAWAAAAVATTAAIAAALARIMAIPGVNGFLTRLSAGSAPRHARLDSDVESATGERISG